MTALTLTLTLPHPYPYSDLTTYYSSTLRTISLCASRLTFRKASLQMSVSSKERACEKQDHWKR